MKKNFPVIIICLFALNFANAQESDTSEVYTIVDSMPEFPGGEKAMFEFITDNSDFFSNCRQEIPVCKYYISFIVEKDGSLSSIKIENNSDFENECVNNEIIRILKLMPKWEPGYLKGEAVRVSYTIPLHIDWF